MCHKDCGEGGFPGFFFSFLVDGKMRKKRVSWQRYKGQQWSNIWLQVWITLLHSVLHIFFRHYSHTTPFTQVTNVENHYANYADHTFSKYVNLTFMKNVTANQKRCPPCNKCSISKWEYWQWGRFFTEQRISTLHNFFNAQPR